MLNEMLLKHLESHLGKKLELNEDGGIITELTEDEKDTVFMIISMSRAIDYNQR